MIATCGIARISFVVSAFVVVLGSRFACADTPGEIPKPWTYEGSMKLQEQPRQQEPQFQQQPQFNPGRRSTSGAGGTAAAEEVVRRWQKRPPLAPDRNPILGKWNPQQSAPADAGNDIAKALLGGMLGGVCDSMFGHGIIEFRATTLVAIGRDGSESVLNHVEYRGDGARVAVLPKDPGSIGVMVFDFSGKDRIRAEGLGCAMARAGAMPATRVSNAAASASHGAVPQNSPAGGVLALSVTSPSAGSSAIAGRALWVLKNDAQIALIKGGLQSSPDGTALQNWMRACQSRMPACQQGARALQAYSVGIAMTDAQGHAQTPPLPAGRYWVLSDAKVDNRRMMWNEPIDLKSGVTSLTLSQDNAMPVD